MRLDDVVRANKVGDRFRRECWPEGMWWYITEDGGFRMSFTRLQHSQSTGAQPDDVLATDWVFEKKDDRRRSR